jgi:hypothetical protein
MLQKMNMDYAQNPKMGRAELLCPELTATQQKLRVTAHGPGYIGTSKKMQFGKYARTTPGLETVSNKKYTYSTTTSSTCSVLLPSLANKFGNGCSGTYIQYSPKTSMVADKQACFCKVEDPQLYNTYTSTLQPDIYTFNRNMQKMNSY